MRIKLLADIAGQNWRAKRGDVIELADDQAAAWVKAGVGQYLEIAMIEPAENAALRTQRPKGRRRRQK